MTPIKRGTARRLGLDLPQDTAIYDETDWTGLAPSMADLGRQFAEWQKRWLKAVVPEVKTGEDR
jgi:hypothetical protein